MADTSYLARVIYRERTNQTGREIDFSDSEPFHLMLRAKTIPSPSSAPNTVESTTLEDRVLVA